MGFVVLENDVGVHRGELAARAVDRHAGVAVGAGEDAVGERRRRHLEPFRAATGGGRVLSARPPPAQPPQTAAIGKGRYAQRNSTIRWISRSHIAWKSCSRWPMTPARFSETA